MLISAVVVTFVFEMIRVAGALLLLPVPALCLRPSGCFLGIVLESLQSPAAAKSELEVSAHTRSTVGAVYRLQRWVAGVNVRGAAEGWDRTWKRPV